MYTKKQIPTPFLQNQTAVPTMSHMPHMSHMSHMSHMPMSYTENKEPSKHTNPQQKNTSGVPSAALGCLVLLSQGER